MQFGLSDERYNRIIAVISRFSTVDEAIIFGSRALGTFKLASDLDLALKGKDIEHNDILKLRRALEELPYGYSYDLLDYKNISNPELLKHIDKYGINFYKKEHMTQQKSPKG